MEWDMAAWDLGELERRDEAAASASNGRGPDCSVDLQLGGGFGRADSGRDQQQPRQGVARGSAKRARAAVSGQSAACMVDGCRSDLSKCKEYHRRHRVCEAHSKTPVVLVGGQQQRFCQQCSRFHSLMEFDEVKRSCRKRLDGHNRRRRKAQPEAASHSRFLPGLQGWNMYHLGSRLPQTAPVFSIAAQRFDWMAEASNQDGVLCRHSTEPHFMGRQQFAPFFPSGFREGKPFPFLQGAGGTPSGGMAMDTPPSVHQLVPNFSLDNSGAGSKVSADCALSLLSSTAQTSGIALRHMVHNSSIPIALPLHRSPQEYDVMCGFSHPVTGDDRGNATATVSGNVGVQSHGCFHASGEGSQSGHSHALPFSWQ